jgi:hypothetical protein
MNIIMMIRFFNVILVFIFSSLSLLFAQDYMVKITPVITFYDCADVIIKENTLYAYCNNSLTREQIPLDNLLSLEYKQPGNYKAGLIHFTLDTVYCRIDSISDFFVFYQEKNEYKKTGKGNILAVYFNSLSDKQLSESRIKEFIDLHTSQVNTGHYLLEQDSSIVEIAELLSLINDTLTFKTKKAGISIKTHYAAKQMKKYIHIEDADAERFFYKKDYIQKKNGAVYKGEVKSINLKQIGYKTILNERIVYLSQSKSNTEALYFHNIEEDLQKSRTYSKLWVTNRPTREVRADISIGYGYRIASLKSELSAHSPDYADQLRLGFTLDASFDFFVTKKLGLGGKYSQYQTSNSDGKFADDIRIIFLGPTISKLNEFADSKGYLYSSLSVGLLNYDNRAVIDGRNAIIKGSALGISLSIGFDIFITGKTTIGLKGGILAGSIKQVEVNSETIQLKHPENLTRLEAMIGIRYYL